NGVLIRAWLNGNELPSVALPTLTEQPTLGATRDGRLSIHGSDETALAFNGYHLAALGTDGDETSMAFDPLAPDGLVIDTAGGLTARLFQPVPLRLGGESL